MVQKYSQPYCLAKYMDLYIAVCCDIAYGTAAPSCGLLVYEQFSTVLKPLMTKVAEIPARWRCQHTFPYSDRITFSSFLTYIILFWMVSAIFKHTNDKTYHKILSKNVFNPGLNVYIFSSKLHLLQGVWTNPHSQKACMVSLELFRISTSFHTVPPPHYEANLAFFANSKISAIEFIWSYYLVQNWQHLTPMKGVIYK